MAPVDWHTLFVPSEPLLETVLRGTLMYWFLFALLRAFRRDTGGLSIADVLLVVVVSDAAQNGMSGEYQSITEGAVLVTTITFWNYAIDWLTYHVKPLRKVFEASPLVLVSDGRLHRKNLRQELISVPELRSLLREHGVDDLQRVRRAVLESDGHLSVLCYDLDAPAPLATVREGTQNSGGSPR